MANPIKEELAISDADVSSSSSSALVVGGAAEDYLALLTPPEIEALNKFKQHEITNGLSDRRLMVYLFARKLNVDRAVSLITNNLAFRKKMDIPVDIPREALNQELIDLKSSFYIPNTTDKLGRAISYLIPARMVPSKYPLEDFFKIMLYLSDQTQWAQPSVHRNGVVVVEDFAHAGFKNFDSRMFKKDKNSPPMEDLFPSRVQAIYLLNPPIVVKPLLKLAKLVVKKKLIQRIRIVKKEELLEFIDKNQLHEHFGGDLTYL